MKIKFSDLQDICPHVDEMDGGCVCDLIIENDAVSAMDDEDAIEHNCACNEDNCPLRERTQTRKQKPKSPAGA